MAGVFATVRDGIDWVAALPGIEYLTALAILVIGWYGSRLLVRFIARPVSRQFTRPSMSRTVLRMIRAGALAVAVILAAGALGLTGTDFLVSTAVFSAVLGIVLAPIVGSIINGVFVLTDQPYEIGDLVELRNTGQRGYVEDITLRYTKLFTLDNTFLVLPNSSIRDRDVVNYSGEDERTRLSLSIVVTYEGDLDRAREIAEDAARDVEEVINGGPDIRIGSARYPAAPTCYIDAFGDHGVELTLRYWVKQPYKLLTIRSAVQERVWDALADADVEIAYPHSHLVFDDTSGEAQVSVSRSRQGPVDPDSRATRHGTAAVADEPDAAAAEAEAGDDAGAAGGDSTDA
jgi:small conductance mechanosensitive channel